MSINYIALPVLVLSISEISGETSNKLTEKGWEKKTTKIQEKITFRLVFNKAKKNEMMIINSKNEELKLDLTNPYDGLNDYQTIQQIADILSALMGEEGIQGITLYKLKASGFLSKNFDLSYVLKDKFFWQAKSLGVDLEEMEIDPDLADREIAKLALNSAYKPYESLPALNPSPIKKNEKEKEETENSTIASKNAIVEHNKNEENEENEENAVTVDIDAVTVTVPTTAPKRVKANTANA